MFDNYKGFTVFIYSALRNMLRECRFQNHTRNYLLRYEIKSLNFFKTRFQKSVREIYLQKQDAET